MKEKEKKIKTPNIQEEDVKALAEHVARNSYGVVAIANKDEVNFVSQITKKGKMEDGVYVHKHSDGTFSVSVYLILALDIKITEALRECQKSIKYSLDKKFPKLCREVDVYAVELR